MTTRYWKVWGICLVILVSCMYYMQQDMLVTWVKPKSDRISENAVWIFYKYSNGKTEHLRQCVEIAESWDALTAIWPLFLALAITSLYAGIAIGYAFRDDDNRDRHAQELSDLESRYKQKIMAADNKYKQAGIWEINSMRRTEDTDHREAALIRWEKSLEQRKRDIEKITEEKVHAIRKQLLNLQEDHKNRGHKMESLEKEKISLKRKNISLEKEVLKLQEENLSLTKDNLTLRSREAK